MKKEFDELLCKKYPVIFRDRRAPMQQTAMCWGFDFGDGWFNIIEAMCSDIQSHINSNRQNIEWTEKWNRNVLDPNYEWTAIVERKEREVPKEIPEVIAIQAKEKFGGLRFYYNGGDSFIGGVVAMAESMSYKTCEVCGNPGKLREERPWIKTLCDKCEEDV